MRVTPRLPFTAHTRTPHQGVAQGARRPAHTERAFERAPRRPGGGRNCFFPSLAPRCAGDGSWISRASWRFGALGSTRRSWVSDTLSCVPKSLSQNFRGVHTAPQTSHLTGHREECLLPYGNSPGQQHATLTVPQPRTYPPRGRLRTRGHGTRLEMPPRSRDLLLELGLVRGDLERVGPRDDLVSHHEARPRGALHRVEVVLVRVRARQEEVGHGRRLRGPVLVLARLLAVERLPQLDDGRPAA